MNVCALAIFKFNGENIYMHRSACVCVVCLSSYSAPIHKKASHPLQYAPRLCQIWVIHSSSFCKDEGVGERN